jgi:hypothetical protein
MLKGGGACGVALACTLLVLSPAMFGTDMT